MESWNSSPRSWDSPDPVICVTRSLPYSPSLQVFLVAYLVCLCSVPVHGAGFISTPSIISLVGSLEPWTPTIKGVTLFKVLGSFPLVGCGPLSALLILCIELHLGGFSSRVIIMLHWKANCLLCSFHILHFFKYLLDSRMFSGNSVHLKYALYEQGSPQMYFLLNKQLSGGCTI